MQSFVRCATRLRVQVHRVVLAGSLHACAKQLQNKQVLLLYCIELVNGCLLGWKRECREC